MCDYCEKLELIDFPEFNEDESSFTAHIDHRGGCGWKPYHILNISHLLGLGYCGDKYFEVNISINYCPFCGRKLSE